MTSAIPWFGGSLGAGGGQGLSFAADLQAGIIARASGGSATPTFTRASTAHMWALQPNDVVGAVPSIVTLASGEPGFWGARRIGENDWSILDANGVPITAANGANSFWADAGGPFGYFSGGARADVLGVTAAIRRTMTDVGWVVGATMTVGSATGADGVASAGASLTGGAVAATNTILFTTVLGSAARTFSVLARRKTGTGTVSMTDNGGTNWTAMTLTTAYKLFQVTRTQANPIVGFKIDTNTDAIEVDFNTIEAAAFANPTPIPVNVSKAADVLTYPSAVNFSDTAGSAYAEFTTAVTAGNAPAVIGDGASANQYPIYINSSGKAATYDGTNVTQFGSALSLPTTSVQKAASSWGSSSLSGSSNGSAVTSGTFDGSMGISSIGIGQSNSASTWLFGTTRNVRLYLQALPASTLTTMTT